MGLPHHHKKTPSAMDKIQEIYKNHRLAIQELSKKGTDLLINGDFRSFEQGLVEILNDLHDKICVHMINETMNNPLFEEKVKEIGSCEGITSLSKRKVSVQLKIGNKCVVESFYGKRNKSSVKIDRHVGLTYLGFVKKASPSYLSISSLVSILCPSFDIGQQFVGLSPSKYSRYDIWKQGFTSIFERSLNGFPFPGFIPINIISGSSINLLSQI